jgi:5-methylcytosine-specific restriction endonuclease McrA
MNSHQKAVKRTWLFYNEGPHCQICGKKYPSSHAPGLTLDHIVPKFQGGGNNIENLRLACKKCNFGRHH